MVCQRRRRRNQQSQARCQNTESSSHCYPPHPISTKTYCPSVFDPAKTLRPSASVTRRAFARLEPSFAKYPSTVTVSPALRESRFQPCRISTLGLPSSKFQLVTLPDSSLTST